jgi:hypothetical protein
VNATAAARPAKRPVRCLARRDSTAQVHVAVDVLALLTPLPFAIRAPGGEYQAETGDRGEPRVVFRPDNATSERVAAM